MDQRVCDIVKTWDIDSSYVEKFYACLEAGVSIAISAYGHTPIDTQVHIAVYTLLTICVDELIMDAVDIEEFMDRLKSGAPQRHPLLHHLAENLFAMPEYFPTFASKTIVLATIDFVNFTLFDKQTENIPIDRSARGFVEYKRKKNGIAEAYSYFIWDKSVFPDILSYIQSLP